MDTTMTFRAVIIDDDTACGESLKELLTRYGVDPIHFAYPMQAIEWIMTHRPDFAFIDLRMPTLDGIEVLKRLKSRFPDLVCVLMSGFGTIDSAVEAMKFGAYDFLLKPIRRKYLAMVLEKMREKVALSREIRELRQKVTQQVTSRLVGQSPAMVELRNRIVSIAKSSATVLILGESGTGKELIIDALHEGSPRKNKPLAKINCGAIPANLFEAELFGFEKGAFTGATHSRAGHLERADGGTVFLDEVGELPPEVQVKILRFLQDQTILRIGGNTTKTVNVRIVSATNKDLYQAIKHGKFREDLFYRLNVVPIHVPPLRERTEDIPLLIRFFLDQCCRRHSKPEKGFTSKALAHLIRYPWPGNVRELQHLCEQAVLTCDGRWISEKHLPQRLKKTDGPMILQIPVGTPLRQAMDLLIKETMAHCGGDIDKAAQLLNIHPKTIRRHVKQLDTRMV